MPYNAVPTKSTGDTWTATENNIYLRDNFAASVPGDGNARIPLRATPLRLYPSRPRAWLDT